MRLRGIAVRVVPATPVCVALALVTCPAVAAADELPASRCTVWTKKNVASGYGVLENLAFDGRGGMLLSEQSATGVGGAIQRLRADGSRSTAAKADGPGGIVVSGGAAYFTTGNSLASGLADRADGRIVALHLGTGKVSTVAKGLHMPNGLARLPGGDFVVSRDIGHKTGLTLITKNGSQTRPYAKSLSSTNGLAYDANRRRLFVSTTFNPTTTIAAIDVDHPSAPPTRIDLPGVGPLNSADDLTVGRDGQVYVALNVIGRIVRLDPRTGRSCVIAKNLPFSTSVRFGSGPGWDPKALYATSFLGTVTKLTPNR